ncbi:Gas vesicle synthesis protein GvpO [Lentibacillus persicus]|uniref:Gas vesicle synthesis protein GvpO n=1 Tax=Lentibacillus persicus TaxID=640948 RepID=A0A1I1S1J5_9BACI|nr:gas vesicle protein GvpO [Lentibacillus persicus]SFD40207.1 Gas vesicle synthesis protein GvpO [Lentibacillus persicus]
MEIKEVMQTVSEFFEAHVAPPHKIISVEAGEKSGWQLTIEVIEEKEYMKKYAKDEMVGVYEVHVNGDKEVTSFKRLEIRYRSKVEQ